MKQIFKKFLKLKQKSKENCFVRFAIRELHESLWHPERLKSDRVDSEEALLDLSFVRMRFLLIYIRIRIRWYSQFD